MTINTLINTIKDISIDEIELMTNSGSTIRLHWEDDVWTDNYEENQFTEEELFNLTVCGMGACGSNLVVTVKR